jgi:Flp pilus assembly protein TadB
MVMESGAATPEAALALTVTLYADPAADLLREAIRVKEVQKVSLEDALDQFGTQYGIGSFGQLADAFRIGRRYGTRLSEILANFAGELRREWHAGYRERITRAPVLMTIPALIFFVGPLLILILFLVFSPLFTVLKQL